MADFEGIWAIVSAGVRQYIGRLHADDGNSIIGVSQQSKDEIQKHVQEHGWVMMKPVYQYTELMAPSPQGVQRLIQVFPLGTLAHDSAVHAEPTEILYLEDMQEDDQKKYKSLVMKAREMMQATRARDTGIVPATEIPRGTVGRAH